GRRVVTQGDDTGTGEGGDVHHRGRLEALGVGEGVAQHQAAFGVGVEDLDGLAGHAGNDVAGLGGAPAGHVLGTGDDADHVDGQIEFSQGGEGADDAGGTAHVPF